MFATDEQPATKDGVLGKENHDFGSYEIASEATIMAAVEANDNKPSNKGRANLQLVRQQN
ncbi:hypothetical protein ABZP36_017677 [Zizania latifolia]